MVFGAGWVAGAILSPSFLQGSHAVILLILIAVGLYITWKSAVIILVRHEEGARGEEQVARVLDALPDTWMVFHSKQAEINAEEFGIPETAVSPMVCVVGGRYGDYPGVKNGVWLGEIQDLGVFLCTPREGHLPDAKRAEVLRLLEEKIITTKKEDSKL
jgi:hypothetical protein